MENTFLDASVPVADTQQVNKVLAGSFRWMALGLFLSFAVSIVTALTPSLVYFIVGSNVAFFVCVAIELGLVIYLSARIQKMTSSRALFFFTLYALVNGLTLSVIFFAFNTTSIIAIFFSTAIMFIVLALFGQRTKRDLTKVGRIAYFGLIGLVVALVVNLFIGSGWLDLVLSWIGVAVFTALTMYDVQKIKRLAVGVSTEEDRRKASVMGALRLYLDFINLFLNLLRIFGRRK